MRVDLDDPFVLDNSIVMVWAFEDENDPYAMRILKAMEDRNAVAPPLLIWELVNVLTLAVRKGRITADHAHEFLTQLQEMSIEFVQPRFLEESAQLLDLALRYGLTAYDAEYLNLAWVSGLPLATLDREILRVMDHSGVERFFP